jgi:cyclopropane fatty-acyl-phospholipid synthase-like methyltransferase
LNQLLPSEDLGLDVPSGQDGHYRAYVGPPGDYDLVAAMAFGLLTMLGLRQHHRVLDLGCGSLRIGRLLIPYLNRGGYTGLEPNAWLVQEGIRREVGQEQIDLKQARFVHADNAAGLIASGSRFDYILAQSIFSHCGPDLLRQWLAQVAALLDDGGALVATFVRADVDTDRLGWIYPECVGFTAASVDAIARDCGLQFTPLDWHHPRQDWALFAKAGCTIPTRELPLDWNARFDFLHARRQQA